MQWQLKCHEVAAAGGRCNPESMPALRAMLLLRGPHGLAGSSHLVVESFRADPLQATVVLWESYLENLWCCGLAVARDSSRQLLSLQVSALTCVPRAMLALTLSFPGALRAGCHSCCVATRNVWTLAQAQTWAQKCSTDPAH